MTAFLNLNGISAPVLAQNAPLLEEEVGSRRRAIDGTLVVDRRAVKRAWDVLLAPDVAVTQLAFRDLLQGKHEIWSWETGAFSSKGNPGAFTGTGVRSSAQAKYGTWAASLGNLNQLNLSWLFFDPLSQPWCAMWWQRDGTTWNHYSADSSGTRRKNGAADTSTFWSAPAAGTLRYTAAGAVFLDEVWVLRFLPPVDWEAAVYAATRALGPGPAVRAEGTLIDGNLAGGVYVVGEAVEMDTAMATLAGVWQQVHTVKAKLREV